MVKPGHPRQTMNSGHQRKKMKKQSYRRNEPAVEWTNLPEDIIREITKKVTNYCDLIRFRSICSSWRQAAISTNIRPQFPWPILPFEKYSFANTIVSFFIPSNRHLYNLELPETRGKQVFGSSFGWIVTVDHIPYNLDGYDVSLLNPITRDQIRLPSLNLPGMVVNSGSRILLCSTPLSTDCQQTSLLLVVWSWNNMLAFNMLAFLKEGSQNWIAAKTNLNVIQGDLAYFENRLYVMGGEGTLLVLDENTWTLRTTTKAYSPPTDYIYIRLVAVAGNLFLITKGPEKFSVFKLQNGRDETKWTVVTNQDNVKFFLSRTQSFWLPDGRLNHIYFLKEYPSLVSLSIKEQGCRTATGICQDLSTKSRKIQVSEIERGPSPLRITCASKIITIMTKPYIQFIKLDGQKQEKENQAKGSKRSKCKS